MANSAASVNFVFNFLIIMEVITVIVPTHNYGLYIAETLESLLQQTYPHWKCLIIDDGSVDNTREIVLAYEARDSRFYYIYQDNQGVSAARNAGLAQAKGEYIQFLDADDLLPTNKFALHVDYLRQNPTVDIVYSDVRYFLSTDKGKLSRSFDMGDVEWIPKVDDAPEVAFWHLLHGNIMPIQAPLSKASLFHEVGLFDATIKYCEDWDYWVRCVVAGGKIRFLDAAEAISLVRVHQTSASQNTVAIARGGEFITEKFTKYLQDNPTAISKRLQTDIKRSRALTLIRNNEYAKGLILFLRTIMQPHNGRISAKDIAYWLNATAFSKTTA